MNFPDTLTPFRFFSQKVLPAVFDDSLSYYELIAKAVQYLNTTMENVNELNSDLQAIYKEWQTYQSELDTSFEEWKAQINSEFNELKQYVDGYFSSLDLTSEVNAIITRYVQDGTIEDMVNEQILQKIQNEVYDNVHGFFDNNGSMFNELMQDLFNPFTSGKKIFIVGDSITWGMNADPIGKQTPRTGVLTDPRNISTSPSWANIVSDFLGNVGILNPTLQTSNWPGSPSGDSIRTYSGNVATGLFPTNSTAGVNGTTIQYEYIRSVVSGLTGFEGNYGIRVTANHNTPRNTDTYGYVSFDIDGYSSIHLAVTPFRGPSVQGSIVDVYVGGNFLRSYTIPTTANFYDLEVQFNNIVHDTVQVRVRPADWDDGVTGTFYAYVAGVKMTKTVTVYNQGIIGSTFYSMLNNCINQNGIAGADYVLTQLGTNDRNRKADANAGEGLSGVYWALSNYDNVVKAICPKRAYMASNNCANLSTQIISQQQIRNIIRDFCKTNNLDFVDNYQATLGFDFRDITTDNLHPNNIGHQIIASNVISAIIG